MEKITHTFLLILLLVCLPGRSVHAQETGIRVNTDWDNERHSWLASWVTHPDCARTEYGVYLFRNRFSLDEVPDSLTVHISADNRYLLLVNGTEVARGPARGSLMHWRYESLNIAPYLRSGDNILAVRVHNLGAQRPAAQFSHQTAFILQAGDEDYHKLNTPGNWKVDRNPAYTPMEVSETQVKGYYVAGPTDRIDGALFPWDWDKFSFDDSQWQKPEVIMKGVGRGYMHGVPWLLVPRNIPMLEDRPEAPARLRLSEGIQVPEGFPANETSLRIPAGTQCKILLDQGYLTSTYPEFTLSGGEGARLTVTYAESLYRPDMWKGHRDSVSNKLMLGYQDQILPDGGENRNYSTLSTRTYRYMEVEIQTGKHPLDIGRIEARFNAYPFERNATVSTGSPFLDRVQDIGWRTARLCASETYMDCPYYEQLQYLGDTRIQSLISLYVSGDDRLMRNTLLQANHSRLPEGLTLSRAPSAIPQIIPAFSLFWIDMVHDYFMHRSDDAFVASFLPGTRAVLGWFERRLREDGMLGGLDWLNFADWTEGYMVGSPPGSDLGGSALISLKFAYALDRAAELHKYFGEEHYARKYGDMSARIKSAVYENCWCPERGLLAGTPDKELFSQHTNIFGILTDAIPRDLQGEVMEKVMADSTLVQTTIYFRFYLFEALFKTGLGDRYLSLLDDWQLMIDKGLTTWEEGDYEERSDCHAWGASPNYHLLSLLCGIRPASPGFMEVDISPHPGKLKEISASMPHPGGEIRVHYQMGKQGRLKAAITLPEGVMGQLHWHGKAHALVGGTQQIHLK